MLSTPDIQNNKISIDFTMEMDSTEILSRCAYNPTSYVHDSIRYSFLGYPQSSPCTGFQNWYSCTVDPHTNYENYPKTTPGSRNDRLGSLCLKCGIANTALLDYDYFCDTGKAFCKYSIFFLLPISSCYSLEVISTQRRVTN